MRSLSSSSFALLVVAVCAVLLVAVPTLTHGAAAAAAAAPTQQRQQQQSRNTALPYFITQAKAALEDAIAPVAATLSPYLPAALRELAPPFLHGAVSLVMVGPAARRPPPCVNGPAGDELLQHTTAKFVYAAGAIAAEVTVLRMVYREPYRNLRRNPLHRLLCGPGGFVLLVLLAAMPNDLVDTSLACVFLGHLSAAVYTPAIVCGQLLRVYVAALVPRMPQLSVAYAALLAYWEKGEMQQQQQQQQDGGVSQVWAEVMMAVVVAGALLFCAAARRGGASAASSSSGRKDRESDGDDYYED